MAGISLVNFKKDLSSERSFLYGFKITGDVFLDYFCVLRIAQTD